MTKKELEQLGTKYISFKEKNGLVPTEHRTIVINNFIQYLENQGVLSDEKKDEYEPDWDKIAAVDALFAKKRENA